MTNLTSEILSSMRQSLTAFGPQNVCRLSAVRARQRRSDQRNYSAAANAIEDVYKMMMKILGIAVFSIFLSCAVHADPETDSLRDRIKNCESIMVCEYIGKMDLKDAKPNQVPTFFKILNVIKGPTPSKRLPVNFPSPCGEKDSSDLDKLPKMTLPEIGSKYILFFEIFQTRSFLLEPYRGVEGLRPYNSDLEKKIKEIVALYRY